LVDQPPDHLERVLDCIDPAERSQPCYANAHLHRGTVRQRELCGGGDIGRGDRLTDLGNRCAQPARAGRVESELRRCRTGPAAQRHDVLHRAQGCRCHCQAAFVAHGYLVRRKWFVKDRSLCTLRENSLS